MTVVVKRYRDCITNRYITYQASSAEPLSSVFDGGTSSYGVAETVRVLTVVAGRHVEIVLQHVGTQIVVRKYGRHFSVAVRTPTEVASAFTGALDIQLCTTGCPVAERLSLRQISVSASVSTENAEKICRQHGLVDFFLDSCVFDFLATGGDRNFSLAAVHALRDYRRLGRDAAEQLHNRTTVSDAAKSRAPAREATVLLYLVILLSNAMSVLHREFSDAACTV